MTVTVRALDDDDLDAVLRFLEPTEHRSAFLVGNARAHGIRDRGGDLQGVWLGAFLDGALRGLIAWFRAPNSVTPACEGHGDALVPALWARIPTRPYVMVGPCDRIAEVLSHLPPGCAVDSRHAEVLLVLRWDDYRPRGDRSATVLPSHRAPEAADLIGLLHRTWHMRSDDARNLAAAERMARGDNILVRERDGRAVAMSCEAAHTGRYVHVGATVCEPELRRMGHARACVSAVIERARAAGRASEGATLFTGEDNHGAIALYESMGFRRDVPWEIVMFAR